MASPLLEKALPLLSAPWSDLHAFVRCAWTSAHDRIEIRNVTVSGAPALDKSVSVENGGEIPIDDAFVPFGCEASWSVLIFVDDITDAPIDGLSVAVEFRDSEGRGVRRVVCFAMRAPSNKVMQIAGSVEAPERSYEE